MPVPNRRERYYSGREYSSFSIRHLGTSQRDWRVGSVSELPEKKSFQFTRGHFFILLSLLLIVFVTVTIIILVRNNGDDIVPEPEEKECPPGFSGDNCDSTSFIGSLLWSADKFYTLSDGILYKKGIAFRVYAPSALRVIVLISVHGGVEEEFPMTTQDNGYWFVNVGGFGWTSEYAYRITYLGNSRIHLLQNGLYLIQRTKNNWRNYEGSYSYLSKSPSTPAVRAESSHVIYAIHLPSFTEKGTYFDASEYAAMLSYLGVEYVHLLPLEASRCNGVSSINPSCWYDSHIVYPGIPHPDFGSASDLRSFLAKLAHYGIRTLSEWDLAYFTTDSDWYNYDGSASSQSFGSLFGSSPVYLYRNQTCSKPDFRSGSASLWVLQAALERYTSLFGFDGFWLKGLLCLRLDGANCEQGKGSDNSAVLQFLREIAGRGWTLMGEDRDGWIDTGTSSVQDVTAPITQGGLGFIAESNRLRGDQLTSILLQKTVRGPDLVSFIESFATFDSQDVLSLNSPETIHNRGRLLYRALALDLQASTALKRLLLLHSVFLLAPGYLHLFMGDEFFTSVPFSSQPSPLNLSEVGSFNEAAWNWNRTGPSFGVFNYTRSLLFLRSSRSLTLPYEPLLYFNYQDTVFALLLKRSSQRTVIVINTASVPTNSSVEIDFPGPYSRTWMASIDSDDAMIFGGTPSEPEEAVLGECVDGKKHTYEKCANITLGAFAFRIYDTN